MKLIAQGAEAKLYREKDVLVKERSPKSYRLPEIDSRIRGSRTRREASVLERLEKMGFPAPRLISSDGKGEIRMDFLKGEALKDVLEKEDFLSLSREIGKRVAELHNASLIHGDLTTSNLILVGGKGVWFVDFGLSFISERVEDKAVDIHLFRQALESRHHTIWEECFDAFLGSYRKHAQSSATILKRLEAVEKRGRNKAKY